MRVQLDKELKQDKEKLAKQLEKNAPVNEAKQLLLNESAEDARILRFLGGNSTLMQLENVTAHSIQLEKLEKEYGQIFTLTQIEALALKYRLRFLNSNSFIGKMDVQVTAMIKEFAKTTGTELNEYDLGRKFFILAEPSAFSLQKRRVEHFQGIKDIKRFISSIKMDPVLFYKVDEEHYRMIHKWGNDFTIYRLILGYKWKNPDNLRTFNFIFQLPFIALLFALLMPTAIITNPIKTLFTILVISAFVAWVRNTYYIYKGGHLSEKNTMYHDKYFTEHNWRSAEKLT